MVSFSLALYTIRLRNKQTDMYEPMGAFDHGIDFLNVAHGYLTARTQNHSIDHNVRRLMRVVQSHGLARRISGIIEAGEYGYRADLYNVAISAVSHQRVIDEAEMLPFYFLINVPQQQDEAILILSRRSQRGIRTILLQDFQSHFNAIYPGTALEINPLVPQSMIDELSRGRITEIRLIKFVIPPDIADALRVGGHVETAGTLEMSVLAGRNGSWPIFANVRDVLLGTRDVNRVLELDGFEYDNAKIRFDIGGKTRTVDLSNIMKLRALIDISDQVTVGPDGHPEFSSVDTIANNLLRDVLRDLGTGGRNAF